MACRDVAFVLALSLSAAPVAQIRSHGQGARAKIAKVALKYLGTPYVWGGSDLRKGIDTGHFVAAVFREAGLRTLAPTVADQERRGRIVYWRPGPALRGTRMIRLKAPAPPLSVLRPGDRIIIRRGLTERSGSRHTGIYIGAYHGVQGDFQHAIVHASASRGVVVDELTSSWMWKDCRYALRD